MISGKGRDGQYAVYDLFTGQQLLEPKYTRILYAADYVYALENNTWHTFRVNRIFA